MIKPHDEKLRCKPAQFDDKITCHLRNSELKALIQLAIAPSSGYKTTSDWLYHKLMEDILPKELERLNIPSSKYLKTEGEYDG